MPKYKITETQYVTGTRTWRYEVEANTEEEALAMIMDGNATPESCTDDFDDDTYDPEFEVEEAK